MRLGIGLGPSLAADAGGASSATTYTATVASGKVSADLTGFPLMIRLADMPAAFWRRCHRDGGNIRATTAGGTSLPCDVLWINHDAKTGLIAVKTDLASASSNSVKITVGSGSMPAAGSTYGRNAVWAAYDAVFPLAGSFRDHTGGNTLRNLGAGAMLAYGSDTFSMNVHQGAKWDGTYWHLFDTDALIKTDAAGTEVLRNSSVLAQIGALAGVTGLDHMGDGAVVGAYIYVIAEDITATTTAQKQCLAKIDRDTYAVLAAWDVSATFGTKEMGAVGYDPTTGKLAVVGFGDAANIYVFTLAGVYDSTLPITNTTGITLQQFQSILWWRDAWLISQNDARIMQVLADGTCVGQIYNNNPGTDSYEGLTEYNGKVGRLRDARDTGGTSRVELLSPVSALLGVGASLSFTLGLKSASRTSRTTFTRSWAATAASVAQQQAVMSYVNAAALGSANRRSTGYINRTSASPAAIGTWEGGGNSWLQATSPTATSTDTLYHVTEVRTATTRRLYINGAQVNSQTGLGAVYSDLDTFLIGYEDDDNAEPMNGLVGMAMQAPTDLGGPWIAARYSNDNAPTSFYTLA